MIRELLNSIWCFVYTGGRVFSEAARGEYSDISPQIEQFRKDLDAASERHGSLTDKENLRNDNIKMRQDVGRAFNQYKVMHGYE
ncbi:MAG: hypothetical protein HDS03_05975 [Bacteroides sp.]|nr:hypothetical protein [Bacteroides sp.]MDE7441172.1 hypothetical protein [Muribaculaceae bacterium]